MTIKLIIFNVEGVFTNIKYLFDNCKINKCCNLNHVSSLDLIKNNNIKIRAINSCYSKKEILNKENINSVIECLLFDYEYIGKKNKLDLLNEWLKELNCNYDDVAYLGNNSNDIEIFKLVKFSACTNDAVIECKNEVDYVCNNNDEECVREFVNFIINNTFKPNINEIEKKYKILHNKLQLIEKEDTLKYFGDWIHRDLDELTIKFKNANPFSYVLIKNFLNDDIANDVCKCFPEDFKNWHVYNNPLEVKYANDNIEDMPTNIQKIFYVLSSNVITNVFSKISDIKDIEFDPCLNGAGLHAHPRYGRLNMHLDYEKHPILASKERRLNIILYLNKEWNEEWNGDTQLWDKNMENCVVKNYPEFNKAIIFQTNDISWHGLPEIIKCPENTYRKSLAYYYISPLTSKSSDSKFGNNGSGHRTKASFIKRPQDKYNEKMEKLYKIRPNRRIEKEDMDEIFPEWDKQIE